MKRIDTLVQKLWIMGLVLSFQLGAMNQEERELQAVLEASKLSHAAEIKAHGDKENHQLAEIAKEQLVLEKQRVERARAADNISLLDLVNNELTALEGKLKAHTAESLIFMDSKQKEAFYADLNQAVKSVLFTAHGLFKEGKILNRKTEELLSAIEKAIEAIHVGLDKKEYLGLVGFLHDLRTKNIVIPERSFESRTSQFALGSAGSACGAMTLIALSELKKSHNKLQGLQQKYPLGLDLILQKGKDAYTAIINQLRMKVDQSLDFAELQDSQAFKDASINWENISGLDASTNKKIETTLSEYVLKPLEDATKAPMGAAAGRAAGVHPTAYGIFTFSGETILLVYNAQDTKWILFDSHRRDKYEGHGAAYHQFSTKADILKYLITYPGLRAGIPIELTIYV